MGAETGGENSIIGRRIRDLRKAKKIPLRVLAEKTGLSTPYLSQVENGRVNITIALAKKISDALEKPISTLFGVERESGAPIVRKASQRWISVDANTKAVETLLFSDEATFEVWQIHLEPGGKTEPNSHPGEEFTHVLRGQVQVILNGSAVHALNPGDVLYYQSSIPHRWENPYAAAVDILVVNSPATF